MGKLRYFLLSWLLICLFFTLAFGFIIIFQTDIPFTFDLLISHFILGGIFGLIGAPVALLLKISHNLSDKITPRAAEYYRLKIIAVGLGLIIGFIFLLIKMLLQN